MSARVRLRRATPDDARGIAEVHVRSWQWAYRGLLPDAILDGLDVEARAERRRQHLDDRDVQEVSIVAEEEDGKIIGFAVYGPSRDEDGHGVGEVHAIYLLPESAGAGIGRELFGHAIAGLTGAGYRSLTVWVLERNHHARQFYERAGLAPDGATKPARVGNAGLVEVRYARDLTP